MKVCPVCKVEFPRSELHKQSLRCIPCHREVKKLQKRVSRRRMAELTGRDFFARHLHDSHVRVFDEFNKDPERFVYSLVHRGISCGLWSKSEWQDKAESYYVGLYNRFCGSSGFSAAQQYAQRYSSDLEFQLKERMRRQQNKAIKNDGIADVMRGALCRGGKSNKVECMLGYTISELKHHLESLFVDGMTWDAFIDGKIHIDHIIPQSSFDLTSVEQWGRCWSLSNLQPLWASDNLSKSDRMPDGTRGRQYA